GFDDGLLAHVHVNWVAPVKTRRTIIAGTKKMIVWDDTSPVEPVKVYESSVDVQQIDKESAYALNVQYRSGDVHSPKLDGREALAVMAQTFAAACLDGAASPSDATAGVRLVRRGDHRRELVLRDRRGDLARRRQAGVRRRPRRHAVDRSRRRPQAADAQDQVPRAGPPVRSDRRHGAAAPARAQGRRGRRA